MEPLDRPLPDPKKTIRKLIGILVMLAIAVSGLVWSVWMLRTLPPPPPGGQLQPQPQQQQQPPAAQ